MRISLFSPQTCLPNVPVSILCLSLIKPYSTSNVIKDKDFSSFFTVIVNQVEMLSSLKPHSAHLWWEEDFDPRWNTRWREQVSPWSMRPGGHGVVSCYPRSLPFLAQSPFPGLVGQGWECTMSQTVYSTQRAVSHWEMVGYITEQHS